VTGDPARPLDEFLDATVGPDDEATLPLLRAGEVEILGRMPWSSNGTFLVTVDDGLDRAQAVYKPEATERPLWDFPPGLWRREVATFVLARGLGWPVVPPTVARDGPLGTGSLQLFVPARFEEHYFTIRDERGDDPALQQLGVLDLIANNTDRKGGHVLVARDGRIWGIDHGLNFHVEAKLRTVLWDWAGDRIPVGLTDAVASWVERDGAAALTDLLGPDEVEATRSRARHVLAAGRFPTDRTGRQHPWPLV
jgi:uncharacterized repeat protein (TIGR03843 family)